MMNDFRPKPMPLPTVAKLSFTLSRPTFFTNPTYNPILHTGLSITLCLALPLLQKPSSNISNLFHANTPYYQSIPLYYQSTPIC